MKLSWKKGKNCEVYILDIFLGLGDFFFFLMGGGGLFVVGYIVDFLL